MTQPCRWWATLPSRWPGTRRSPLPQPTSPRRSDLNANVLASTSTANTVTYDPTMPMVGNVAKSVARDTTLTFAAADFTAAFRSERERTGLDQHGQHGDV